MPIQIGAKPDSGFDDPLGMLKDCHRRIERFLRVLCIAAPEPEPESVRVLVATVAARPVPPAPTIVNGHPTCRHPWKRALLAGGRRHNADEEESLFPRLRQARPEASRDQIGRLEEEHRRTEALHERVETL